MIFAFLSFAISFSLYLYTICPTISVYADAGEFSTMAFISGFGHPPGYPLYILLVKLFQLLPFTDPAFKANLCAAFFGAVTISLFYLLAKHLTKSPLSALVSAFILAFSQVFWKNSLVSEVFSLLAFFVVLTLLLYLKWTDTKSQKYFYLFILAGGFGLAHHQLLIFSLLPLLVHLIISGDFKLFTVRKYLYLLLLFLLGFTPYLYIYFISAPGIPVMNWEDPSTLAGLFRLITRSSYGTFILTTQGQSVNYLDQIWGIIKIYLRSFTPVLFPLLFLGIWSAVRKFPRILLISVIPILLVIALSLSSGMPAVQSVQIQYLERFQIITSIYLCLIVAAGITLIKKKFRPLLLIIPVSLLIINFSVVTQRGNYFGKFLGNDIMSSVQEKSVFLIEGDALINDVFYYQHVLNQKKSVAVIIADLLVSHPVWYIKELQHNYPVLVFPDENLSSTEYFQEFIKLNSKNQPVYLHIFSFESEHNLQLPKSLSGLVWRYTPDGVKDDPAFSDSYKNINPLITYPEYSSERNVLNIYTDPLVYLGETFRENFEVSQKYFQKALEITPDNGNAMIGLGDTYFAHQKYSDAVSVWRQSLPYLFDNQQKSEVWSKILSAPASELRDL